MYSAISGRFSADHLAVRDLKDSFHQEKENQRRWANQVFESPFPNHDLHYYTEHYQQEEDGESDDDSVSAQPGIGGPTTSTRFLPTMKPLCNDQQPSYNDTPTLASTLESSHSPSPRSPAPRQSSYLQSYLTHTQQQQQQHQRQNYIHVSDQASLQLSALTPDSYMYDQQSSVASSSNHDGLSYSRLSDNGAADLRRTPALEDGISTTYTNRSEDLLDRCFSELEELLPTNATSVASLPPQEDDPKEVSFADQPLESSFLASPEQEVASSFHQAKEELDQSFPKEPQESFESSSSSPNKKYYSLACVSTETTMTSFSTAASSDHLDKSTDPINGPSSWQEWKEEADRQMSRYYNCSDENDLEQELQKDFDNLSNQHQAMAVAFLKGAAWQRKQQREPTQQQEPAKQQEQPKSQQIKKQERSTAFRKRWLAKQRAKEAQDDDEEEAVNDTRTVATTALTTMSCRELSMRRYQLSFLKEYGQEAKQKTKSSIKNLENNNTNPTDNNSSSDRSEVQRLLEELQRSERRQKKLEEQLKRAGVVLAEDIPYQEAKDQVARISQRMNQIGSSEAEHEDPEIQRSLREEYYRLEKDMEKYMNALLLTDEFMQEQKALEDAWEKEHEEENRIALAQVRKYMPVDVRLRTRQELEELGLPDIVIRKFQRTNVLQLLRRDPEIIARWHPCNLEALRLTGLTLTERRALHHHLLEVSQILDARGSDPLTRRKLTWVNMMRTNLKEALDKYKNHLENTDGRSGSEHKCSCIGRQCPVRADRTMDYSGDGLGFPCGDVYEESMDNNDVPIARATIPRSAADKQPSTPVSTKTEAPPATKRPSKPAAPANLLDAIRSRKQSD